MSYLTKPVPLARRPMAKPQASWQTLKVGQRLCNTSDIIQGVLKFPAGELWEVVVVDSLGARLLHTTGGHGYTLRDPGWKTLFERVRAPVKRRKKLETTK